MNIVTCLLVGNTNSIFSKCRERCYPSERLCEHINTLRWCRWAERGTREAQERGGDHFSGEPGTLYRHTHGTLHWHRWAQAQAHCIGRPLARVGKGLEHSSGVRLRGFRGLLRKSMFLDEQFSILLDLKRETIDFKHKEQRWDNRPGSSCNHLGIYISCLSGWGWSWRNLRVWVW